MDSGAGACTVMLNPDSRTAMQSPDSRTVIQEPEPAL